MITFHTAPTPSRLPLNTIHVVQSIGKKCDGFLVTMNKAGIIELANAIAEARVGDRSRALKMALGVMIDAAKVQIREHVITGAMLQLDEAIAQERSAPVLVPNRS